MTDEGKKVVTYDDGFTDWGDDDDGQHRVIQGTLLRFANEGIWTDNDGEPIPKGLALAAMSICRVIQKWVDKMSIREETRFLQPGEKAPDIAALNERCPRSEWGLDFNKNPKGPFELSTVLYLFDPETMQKYTFPTRTVGGNIAIGELKDATAMMRKFRGPSVLPIVALASKHMNTRFGGRMRPHLEIMKWISLDQGGGPALPPGAAASALPSPEPASQAPLERKAEAKNTLGARTVEEPTLREELNDSIDF
jgi:hypothetical protein